MFKYKLLNEGGYLIIIVSPKKSFIVGCHISIYIAGLYYIN